MKKRMIAMLMAAVLCVSSVPFSVWAGQNRDDDIGVVLAEEELNVISAKNASSTRKAAIAADIDAEKITVNADIADNNIYATVTVFVPLKGNEDGVAAVVNQEMHSKYASAVFSNETGSNSFEVKNYDFKAGEGLTLYGNVLLVGREEDVYTLSYLKFKGDRIRNQNEAGDAEEYQNNGYIYAPNASVKLPEGPKEEINAETGEFNCYIGGTQRLSFNPEQSGSYHFEFEKLAYEDEWYFDVYDDEGSIVSLGDLKEGITYLIDIYLSKSLYNNNPPLEEYSTVKVKLLPGSAQTVIMPETDDEQKVSETETIKQDIKRTIDTSNNSVQKYNSNTLNSSDYVQNVKKALNLKVSGPKAKAQKKKKAKVTWKAITGVSGYEIQYSVKKSFKKAKNVTVKGAGKKKVMLKKLKAGKKYYIRIRPYTNVSNPSGKVEKINGKWSKILKIKAKK
ncbi:MAG: fibronectin type III domain-containing protein [Eubacterium sp.]|nr:fibronectin type III domain-containing protein [Eubacterium sp.]